MAKKDPTLYDIIIVGGGIVGIATAYQLSQRYGEKLRILLLEKESELAYHQTGHNSGVIHSGVYYKPGSLRALNCNTGRKLLVEFCKEHHIQHDVCGKVIVATDESEVPYLEKIHENGIANGTEGLELIGPEAIKEIEPYCEGVKALYVGCSGIINYQDVGRKMAEIMQAKGVLIKLKQEVVNFNKKSAHTNVVTKKGKKFKAKHLIVCGGHQSDRLAKKYGLDPGMRIVGFRGEYYDLVNHDKVNHLIYPVPNPKFPWLGVHFTRMIDGRFECGPNAVFAFKREGYNKTDFNLRDVVSAVTYSGFWKLTTRHLAYGMVEQWRSISKKAFLESLQKLIPSLTMDDIEPGRAGVRALALAPDGNMIDDFKFVHAENAIHILNAPSPAATSCLSIGNTIADMAVEKFGLANRSLLVDEL